MRAAPSRFNDPRRTGDQRESATPRAVSPKATSLIQAWQRIGTTLAMTLALTSSGCIPVAMLSTEHRFAGGLAAGRARGNSSQPAKDVLGAQFQYRVSIAPLSMVRELWDRDFDFDLGYLVMVHDGGSLQHGPSVGAQYFLTRWNLDERPYCDAEGLVKGEPCAPPGQHSLLRIAARAEADLRFTDAEPRMIGFGARGGFRLDLSIFPGHATPVAEASEGNGSTPTAALFTGVTWGEYGLAVDILGGGGMVGTQTWAEVLFALTLRIPSIAGILIVIP